MHNFTLDLLSYQSSLSARPVIQHPLDRPGREGLAARLLSYIQVHSMYKDLKHDLNYDLPLTTMYKDGILCT